MKKKAIVFAIMCLIIIAELILPQIAIATDADYQPSAYSGSSFSGQDKVDKVGQNIVGIIRIIGSAVSVIMLIALGIKYVMGSTEERAEYKKSMMPYLVGALLIFGASTVTSIIYNFAKGIGTK